jgi:RNA polymerase sigma factor (sigma-70 family)
MTGPPSKKKPTFPEMNERAAPKADLAELMHRIGGGSDEAVWELLDRYSTNILRVVRRYLPQELRTKVDSVDIVQSVWKSMLSKGAAFDHIKSAEDFVGYIAGVARNKVLETHRKFQKNTKRDIHREQPIARPSSAKTDDPDFQICCVDPRSADPPSIAHARDNWNRALKKGGPNAEQVIRLRLEGMSMVEIAEDLGKSEYHVRQTLASLLKSLQV